MNTDTRKKIGVLLQTERERLGFSQAKFATLGGTKPRTLQDWERGTSTPSAEFLSNTTEFGLDVLYVITGQRNTKVPSEMPGLVFLKPKQQALIANHDAASEADKKIIEGVARLAAQPLIQRS